MEIESNNRNMGDKLYQMCTFEWEADIHVHSSSLVGVIYKAGICAVLLL